MVLGHSLCGGAVGCKAMCSGHAPELERPGSFTGRWMDLLRPGWGRVKDIADDDARCEALEKQAVLVSLDNVMTFPFVSAAVEAADLVLHGLWNGITAGGLEIYEASSDHFRPL